MMLVVKKFDELTPREVYEILKARALVFALEQNIRCLDMDDTDYESLHIFSVEEGRVTAYLRAFPLSETGKVKIGRVLTLSRGKGVGKSLMERSLAAISEQFDPEVVVVDAQAQARGFYEKCGFTAVSEEFMEEGIPHVRMERKISSSERGESV
ncbi:MAG: GNAT family N-acetyltransferase [Clostridia bacterium]|nr:GNAT family N-acetyltransferase [Clostridia bacterium]